MRILKEKTVALMIDIQEKLFPHIAEKENLLIRSKILIEGLKVLGIPILVTEQYKKGLGNTLPEISELITESPSFEKISFSCCDDAPTMNKIASSGKPNVIIFGIETHVCVLQTVLDLIEKGYQPIVIADCVSSRNISDKTIALKRIRREGAIVSTSESILFELTRFAGNDPFKAISKIVK